MQRYPRLWGLLAVLVFMLPASARACGPASVRPVIHIATAEAPARFDLGQTISGLSKLDIDSLKNLPSENRYHIGGVMNGQIDIEHKIWFSRWQKGEKACSAIKQIDITITMRPTIYIASEYYKNSCWFKQIFAHETRHVEIDRAVLQKYKSQFADTMNVLLFEPADYNSPWVNRTQLAQTQGRMQENIEQAIRVMFDKLLADRQRQQLAIDTPDEYDRIGRACQISSLNSFMSFNKRPM